MNKILFGTSIMSNMSFKYKENKKKYIFFVNFSNLLLKKNF